MMPKSFADDQATGAGVASASAPTSSASTTSASTPSSGGTINYSPGGSGSGSASFTPQKIPDAPTASSSSSSASGTPSTAPYSYPSPQLAPTSGLLGSNVPKTTGGVYFDEGGSVPDDNGQGQGQKQDPMSAILQKALGSVDQVLQYGYQQYGLTTGDQNQQGGVQEAANMPTVPAGQSETGIPPQRPGPGTLPPTSNPFGKRAGIDTDSDNDQEAA